VHQFWLEFWIGPGDLYWVQPVSIERWVRCAALIVEEGKASQEPVHILRVVAVEVLHPKRCVVGPPEV
jgi:hypothetical protein